MGVCFCCPSNEKKRQESRQVKEEMVRVWLGPISNPQARTSIRRLSRSLSFTHALLHEPFSLMLVGLYKPFTHGELGVYLLIMNNIVGMVRMNPQTHDTCLYETLICQMLSPLL